MYLRPELRGVNPSAAGNFSSTLVGLVFTPNDCRPKDSLTPTSPWLLVARRAARENGFSIRSPMHVIPFALVLGATAAATQLFAGCPCPPQAASKHLLISTGSGPASGFVACGYEDARSQVTIRSSELEVFRCDNGTRILAFDALQTADLTDVGADLAVVRVSRWPFGKHWSWVFVPVAETMLGSTSTSPRWKPRLPRPELTDAEVRHFVSVYSAKVRRLGRSYAPDENTVGQLFAAMASGDRKAARLFQSMRRDVNLDGAAGELYAVAVAEYALGRPPN